MLPNDLPRLDELEAKAAAATPGPWRCEAYSGCSDIRVENGGPRGTGILITSINHHTEGKYADAAFIASAPDAVRLSRALADALEELASAARGTAHQVNDEWLHDRVDEAQALLEAIGYAPRGEAYKPKEEACPLCGRDLSKPTPIDEMPEVMCSCEIPRYREENDHG